MKNIAKTGLIWGLGLLAALAGSARAAQVDVKAALATPVVQAGKAQTAFLKVALTGFALPARGARPPLNVAIVIDRSGSMSGEKMSQARHAAVQAVDFNDIRSGLGHTHRNGADVVHGDDLDRYSCGRMHGPQVGAAAGEGYDGIGAAGRRRPGW